MSIWADIHARSVGDAVRKEDAHNLDEIINDNFTFFGDIDPRYLGTKQHQDGKIYYINDDYIEKGYHKGDIVISYGNEWHIVSPYPHTDNCIGVVLSPGEYIGQ